ncbi:beta strand repeat-containing protein, partial [Microbulbifer agarilyticus]
TDNALTAGAVTLTGTANEVSAFGLVVSGLDSVTSANVTGSTGADVFVVDGTNSLDVFAMQFTGVQQVTAGGADNSATGAASQNWTLAGNNTATNSGITFNAFELVTANNASLVGSAAGSDIFTIIQGSGGVEVSVDGYDATFTGLTSVVTTGNTNALTADAVTLTGNANEVSAFGLVVDGLNGVTSANVTGSTGADAFVVDGTNSLDVLAMQFSGVQQVTAGGADNSAVGAANQDWALAGNNAASTSGITFSDFESLAANNAGLMGSAGGSDTFAVTQGGTDVEVIADGYDATFTGLTSVTGTGTDNALTADEVTLTGNANEVSAFGLVVSGLDSVTSASISGAADSNESFVITGDQTLQETLSDITFGGVSTVAAGENTQNTDSDSVRILEEQQFELPDSDSVSFSNITFTEIETIDTNGADLTTASAGNTFTVSGGGELSVNDSAFTYTNLSSISGSGTDTLNADTVTLTGNANEVSAFGLVVDGLSSVTSANVTGSAGADAFVVDGTNSLDVLAMQFSGVQQVTAGGSSNAATGAASQ